MCLAFCSAQLGGKFDWTYAVLAVNGGWISGQRGGVKAGQ